MPLATAAPTLKAAILLTYKGLKDVTPAQKANEIANAVYTALTQAVPQTVVNGNAAMGQAVASFVTTSPSPVTGSGSGGLDKTTPKGLDAAKGDFVSALEASYKDKNLTADKAAQILSDAIIKLYGEAKVMTNVTGIFATGAAVPAPAGPVAPSPWTGNGKGGIEGVAGTGLVTAKLAKDLEIIYKNFPRDHKEAATKWANALIAFAKTAKVTTTDTGNAGGGAATVDPSTGTGSTLAPSALINSKGVGFVT